VEVTAAGAKVVVDPKTGRRLVLGPAVAAKVHVPEVRPPARRRCQTLGRSPPGGDQAAQLRAARR
jgi:hypothetical protein